jgi:ADP-heptose:LPS heptosyltransferase
MTPDRTRLRETYRAGFSRPALPIIGVQPYSRETYRNAPALLAAIGLLAQRASVVVFHSTPVEIPSHPNVVLLHGQPLEQTLAAIAACDYFISVDSGLFHVAAAFEIPTLGIFGPTDGKIVSRHHPCATVLDAPTELACKPCWRSEDRACHLTSGQTSACLASIRPDAILAAVEQLMRRHPVDPNAGSTTHLLTAA